MRVRNGHVTFNNRVRVVGTSVYAGREGTVIDILDDRGRTHQCAIVILDDMTRANEQPFLGRELEKR